MEEKSVQEEEGGWQSLETKIRWRIVIPLVCTVVVMLAFLTLCKALRTDNGQDMSSTGASSVANQIPQVVSSPHDEKISGYVIVVDESAFKTEKKGVTTIITPINHPMNQPPLSLKIEQIPDVTAEKALEQEKEKMLKSAPPPERARVPDKTESDVPLEPQRHRPVFLEGVWDWVIGVAARYRPTKTVRIFDNGREGVFLITEVLFMEDREGYAEQFNAMLATLEIL